MAAKKSVLGYEITPLIITSEAKEGKRIEDNGSSVEFTFSPPIHFPPNSRAMFRVLRSDIWYVNSNISAEKNNNFFSYFYDGSGRVLQLPEGLYSIGDINSRISEFTNNQHGLPNLFQFIGDNSTGTTTLRVEPETGVLVFIDVESGTLVANTVVPLLGFTTDISIDGSKDVEYVESSNVARLNNLTNYVVHTSFTTGVYADNIGGSGIVATVSPNIQPGGLITVEPQHPLNCYIYANHLDTVRIWLTNEKNEPITMRDEIFTLTCEILY